MKKLYFFLMIAFLIAVSGVTAYAQSGVSYIDVAAGAGEDAVIIGEPGVIDSGAELPAAASAPVSVSAPAADSEVYPLNVETVTENGMVLVKKTYEFPEGTDPSPLAEDFERDGYSFALRDILRQEQRGGNESRHAVKTAMAITDSDDEAGILAQFPATINHEEDGFAGRLTLDPASLVTEPEEYETYTYAYTETEEVNPLDRNDPALLEKERQGMTLAGIEFEGRQEEQVGGSLVPSSYAATATWQGTATGQRPVSFLTTATYSGEITRTALGSELFTFVYSGTPLVQSEPVTQTEPIPQRELPTTADIPAAVTADAAVDEPATEEPTAEESAEQTAAPVTAKPSRPVLSDDTVAWLIPAVVVIILLSALLLQNHRNSKKERIIRRQNREAIEEIRRFIYGDAKGLA